MSETQGMEFNQLPSSLQPETPVEKWTRENQKGIDVLTKFAEENGSFSDYQRAF